jgi:hypothetical protein
MMRSSGDLTVPLVKGIPEWIPSPVRAVPEGSATVTGIVTPDAAFVRAGAADTGIAERRRAGINSALRSINVCDMGSLSLIVILVIPPHYWGGFVLFSLRFRDLSLLIG